MRKDNKLAIHLHAMCGRIHVHEAAWLLLLLILSVLFYCGCWYLVWRFICVCERIKCNLKKHFERGRRIRIYFILCIIYRQRPHLSQMYHPLHQRNIIVYHAKSLDIFWVEIIVDLRNSYRLN